MKRSVWSNLYSKNCHREVVPRRKIGISTECEKVHLSKLAPVLRLLNPGSIKDNRVMMNPWFTDLWLDSLFFRVRRYVWPESNLHFWLVMREISRQLIPIEIFWSEVLSVITIRHFLVGSITWHTLFSICFTWSGELASVLSSCLPVWFIALSWQNECLQEMPVVKLDGCFSFCEIIDQV